VDLAQGSGDEVPQRVGGVVAADAFCDRRPAPRTLYFPCGATIRRKRLPAQAQSCISRLFYIMHTKPNKRVRELRGILGQTQEAFAATIGASKDTVVSRENGRRRCYA
jgi:hypothetical protein